MSILLDENPNTKSYVCMYDADTCICGYMIDFDYRDKVESKMIEEPFYGDIDLFGF